jgi:hypothetical protein
MRLSASSLRSSRRFSRYPLWSSTFPSAIETDSRDAISVSVRIRSRNAVNDCVALGASRRRSTA